MNDANLALLIGLIGTVVSGVVIPIVTHYLNDRKITKQNTKLDDMKSDVHAIEKATNSMKDDLIKTTKALALTEGHAAGHAEGMVEGRVEGIQKEQDAQKLKDASTTQIRITKDKD